MSQEPNETGQPTNANKYDRSRYLTEAEAFEHANTLRQYGIWPGVVRYHDGQFGLTFNPTHIARLTLNRRLF